VSNLI